MTRFTAQSLGKPPGYALRIDSREGNVVYLADYRTAPFATTEYPSSAEYFERAVDAGEMARRISFLTGQRWLVTTVPADNTGECWTTRPAEPQPQPLTPEQERETAFRAALEAFILEAEDDDLARVEAEIRSEMLSEMPGIGHYDVPLN